MFCSLTVLPERPQLTLADPGCTVGFIVRVSPGGEEPDQGGKLEDAELRDLARLLISVQALMPSIFFAGLLGSVDLVGQFVRRTLSAYRSGGVTRLRAEWTLVFALALLFAGLAATSLLFALAPTSILLYLRQTPADPRHFIYVQIGFFAVTAVVGVLMTWSFALLRVMR